MRSKWLIALTLFLLCSYGCSVSIVYDEPADSFGSIAILTYTLSPASITLTPTPSSINFGSKPTPNNNDIDAFQVPSATSATTPASTATSVVTMTQTPTRTPTLTP